MMIGSPLFTLVAFMTEGREGIVQEVSQYGRYHDMGSIMLWAILHIMQWISKGIYLYTTVFSVGLKGLQKDYI